MDGPADLNRAVLMTLLMALLMALGLSAARAQPVADPAKAGNELRLAGEGVQLAVADREGFVAARFEPGRAPTLTVAPVGSPWDWQAAASLKLHLQNTMAWPVTLRITVSDVNGDSLSSELGVPPGPPQTLVVPLQATEPRAWGMQAAPPMPWVRVDGSGGAERLFVATTVRGRLDASRVSAISLEIPNPVAPQVLRIGKLFTEPRQSGRDDLREVYSALIDGFGQSTRGDWPQKVRGLDDLKAAARREDQELAPAVAAAATATPAPVRGRASGFFRVERQPRTQGGERWWLIDPQGRRFFSIGANTVRHRGDDTIVEGREFMFTELPAELADERFSQRREPVLPADSGAARGRAYARGRSVDFYRLNLWRRDGDQFEPRWRARTRDRLLAWSFNTVANWSDPVFVREARLPFVKAIAINGTFTTISDGVDLWGQAPDPFDPRFALAVRQSVEAGTRDTRAERQLIGYFVDNEVAWGDGGSEDPRRRYALAMQVLRLDAAHSPAKRAFIALLKRLHVDSRRLSALWGLPVASWGRLAAPFDPPLPSAGRPSIADDYSAFLALHADNYFATVHHELKRADPDHLYLGVRFAARTPEAVAACARWCDVVSFNLYVPSVASGFEAAAFHALGKPALLSEFHFGATDRGPFGGGVIAVPRSADRGRAYRALLESVADNPDFVGAHWFQYVDEPASGRWLDGENGHMGLVAITDLPWADFVAEVTQANRAIQRRLAAD